jgi:hypothetical protein
MKLHPSVVAAARAAQTRRHVRLDRAMADRSGNGDYQPGNNGFGMKPRKGMNDPCQMLKTTEWTRSRRLIS